MTRVLDSYVLDKQVGYLLRLASQRHAGIFQRNTVEGLTPTQFSTMMRVHEQGEVSQNHLGRLAAMDVATIKGVVDRLKSKGFVTSCADPKDKRRMIISLSPQGQALIADMQRAGEKITDETLAPLSDAEKAELVKLLGKIS